MNSKCNHDINSPNTTLQRLPKRLLIHPETVYFGCPICKKTFKYVKGSEGQLTLVED